MADCLFCTIVAGEVPATTVLETDRILAFRDIDPQATASCSTPAPTRARPFRTSTATS